MRRGDLAAIAGVFVLALALRLHGVTYPPQRWADEQVNVAAAVHYAEQGRFEPDTWQHPPLRNLTEYAFVRALGDGPYGWRLRNVLLGAATAALTWLVAFHATASRKAALLAALLLATDPLHVVLSRFTFEEVAGGAFFLASLAVFAAHRQRTWWLVGSALLVGCAVATKWYYLPGWLLMLFLLLREDGRWRDLRTAAFLASAWTLVPLGVYVASYLPWFGRGFRLGELPEFAANSYAFLQSMSERYVRATDTRTVFHGHGSALEWFVRPIAVGYGFRPEPDRWEFILYVNDLPIWILTIPALIGLAVAAIRRRSPRLALPAALFAALYLPLVLASRPVFVYSAIAVLPFALVAIGFAVAETAERLGPRTYGVVLAATLAWNLYLYPLVTTRRVPPAPYRPLVEAAEIEWR